MHILGLERRRRGDERIEVQEYDGGTIPHPDRSFDVVLLADVLHHEADPHALIRECARVSRRLLIIKDHKVEGPFAQQRIAFMDWAANAPYGVPCLYRYNTAAGWADWHRRHHLVVKQEFQSIILYPRIYNWLFGNRLQYMAILEVGIGSDW